MEATASAPVTLKVHRIVTNNMPADHQLPRGVYRAPYRIDGCPVLYAVTSAGERLKKIVVLRPGVSEERAVRWFEEILDRVDPRPQLRLVPDQPPSALPKQIPLEEIEKIYRDADPIARLFWARKKARMMGGTLVSR